MDLSGGFALYRTGMSDRTLTGLADELTENGEANRRYRGQLPARCLTVLEPIIQKILAEILTPNFVPRRILFFNKSGDNNWFVPWHQDRTIIVKEQCDVQGYSHWTTKDGMTHVEPPVSILEDMLTLRLHLDPMTEDNGGLRVLPSSHIHGRLAQDAVLRAVEEGMPETLACEAGDILLMRPLLVHSSKKSTSHAPRRILHIEFSDATLPKPLEWTI